MPYSSAQLNIKPYPAAKTLNTPHNETFTNYNLVEITVRILEVDNEDPINSSISLEHRIKERFQENYYLNVENIITKIDHVQIDGKDFVNVYGDLFLVKEFNNVNTNVLSKYQDVQIVYTALAGGLIGSTTSSKKSTKGFKISKKIKEIP